MKTLISSYTFNAASKTITFTGYGSISLNRVLTVFNQTAGIEIYRLGSTTLGGSVATNVLTLTYNTAAMNNSDSLLIYYDDSAASIKVDGSGVTQPVSGTITANAGTNLNTSALALESGGNLATTATTLGATTDAKVTGDTSGSVSAKLRGLNYFLNLVTDTVNSLFHVNLKQVGANAVKTNSGNGSAGSLNVYLATDQPVLTNPQPIYPTTKTTGGATPYKLNSAASTNATSVKASAGTLYSISATNTNASARYLKIYDKASAPTVGTDVPKLVYLLPGNASGSGSNPYVPPVGVVFSNGIAFAITGGAADNDSTAVSANDVIVNLSYA